jgi:hypothetical protein
MGERVRPPNAAAALNPGAMRRNAVFLMICALPLAAVALFLVLRPRATPALANTPAAIAAQKPSAQSTGPSAANLPQ